MKQNGEKFSPARESKRLRYLPDLTVSYEGLEEKIGLAQPTLSAKGMFINTPARFQQGAVLKVSFRLPRANFVVKARCEVRNCDSRVGVGVEFINLPEDAHRAIEREIEAAGRDAENAPR